MPISHPLYRGRFAPSPTGPLHFGSLIAAVGSFLDARARGGEWLLRMEDIDAPRCSMAAAENILRTLECFGFAWDGAVVWQHQREAAYADALVQLQKNGQVFSCACTRRELADSLLAADGAAIYPGTCRLGVPEGKMAQGWRVRVSPESMRAAPVVFEDAIQGRIESDLSRDAGDFIVRRADGLFAYQLAVVVDDAAAGVTHVVRGADLLLSTSRQIFLQQSLGLSTPLYAHLPVAVNEVGEKLSKQTLAMPLDVTRPVVELISALAFLGQKPPPELLDASLDELWAWAIRHWQLENVPRQRALPASEKFIMQETS
ncbi:MAG TPA: tRNA glutamyl-Q(34) synthetase GluQRS [Rugosibacter sp.]